MPILDPYRILGISQGATQEQIKRAYRRQARLYHPDLNKSPDAKEKFLEVQLAYDLLSRPESERHEEGIRGEGWTASRPSSPSWPTDRSGESHKVRVARGSRRVTSPFYGTVSGMESWERAGTLSHNRAMTAIWVVYIGILGGASVGFILFGLFSISTGNAFGGVMASSIGLILLVILVMVLGTATRSGFLRER